MMVNLFLFPRSTLKSTLWMLRYKVSDSPVEDPSRCVGEEAKSPVTTQDTYLDELNLSESDEEGPPFELPSDSEDHFLDSENVRIASLASSNGSEKTDPTVTGYSGYSTLGSTSPPDVGNQQSYVVLPQPEVRLQQTPNCFDEHQLNRKGLKRPHEDSPCSPVGPSPSTSRQRKRVCDVAPPGSQGSFDFNSFAPSESWNDVISSEAFSFSNAGENDEELKNFQKLYSQLRSRLPINSIDYLIYLLGGREKVAELSGRKSGITYQIKKDQNPQVPYGTSYARGKTDVANKKGT